MGDIEKLKFLLDDILGDVTLRPEKDAQGNIEKTFCNIAVQRVLNAYAYHSMDGLMADDMCKFMDSAPEWISVNSGIAQLSANQGQVGIAAHPYVGHGHVAMIAPGKEAYSGHWGVLCPIVANVGKNVGYMGANMAFPITETPPKYYLLKQGEI